MVVILGLVTRKGKKGVANFRQMGFYFCDIFLRSFWRFLRECNVLVDLIAFMEFHSSILVSTYG